MSERMCWVAWPDCIITEHHLSGTQSSCHSPITSLCVEGHALTQTHKDRPRLQAFHLSLAILYGPLIYKFIETVENSLYFSTWHSLEYEGPQTCFFPLCPNLPPSSLKTHHLYYIRIWFILLITFMEEYLLRSFLAIKFWCFGPWRIHIDKEEQGF